MKIENFDERIHILDNHSSVLSVLNDITEKQQQNEDAAFYICDIGDIVLKYKLWKNYLPRIEPFYAVKCNDSLIVLEILAGLGTGFDCASKNEITKILNLGVNTNKIVFANPAKPSSHIRYAATMGVDTMTFDNECELHKIKNLHPNANLVIRIRCDAKVAQCQLGMKFGCDPITEAPNLLDLAHSLNLNVIGVSFHVGSGCKETNVYFRAISLARDIFNLGEKIGFSMTLLDIGGGFPGDRDQTNFVKITECINMALDQYFPTNDVKIIAEPGRFFVSSAYTLACNIHSIRDVVKGDVLHKMYYINDGVYGSFNCILYDHQSVVAQPLIKEDGNVRKYYESSIWGPTCDGLDQVVEKVQLPEMQIGDWFVFENMGAYTLPVASPFNGFPLPNVHIVVDENIWIYLKDLLVLNDCHFTIGNNITIDMPIFNDNLNLTSLTMPVCNDGNIFEFTENLQ